MTGGLSEPQILKLLASPSEYLRAWAIQLELEDREASPDMLRRLAALAAIEPSPWVRLALASGLQRLPLADRWTIATALAQHAEDANDANLPLMIWYGVEPLVPADGKRGLELALSSRIPLVTKFIARRAGEDAGGTGSGGRGAGPNRSTPVIRRQLLEGRWRHCMGIATPRCRLLGTPLTANFRRAPIRRYAAGRGHLPLFSTIRASSPSCSSWWPIPRRRTADRSWAIERLLEARDPQLIDLLESLVASGNLSGLAVRGLAVFDSPKTPTVLLAAYGRLNEAEQRDAVNTLCARPQWALALLKAIDHGELPRTVLSVEQVRQIAGFGNADVSAELDRVWGVVREPTADKKAQLENYRGRLSADRLKAADRGQGRAIFARVCANCHTLFDTGGNVGPNLTGSQRANLDYVLTNVLDPNSAVPKEYQMVVIQTTDGRVLNGIIKAEDDLTLALQTTNEIVTLSKDEIEVRKATPNSMMPEGMLIPMSDADLCDLMAYLASPEQVPLPPSTGEGNRLRPAERECRCQGWRQGIDWVVHDGSTVDDWPLPRSAAPDDSACR